MTYEEALAYIASLETRGWRLGLDRMEEFAKRLGLPGSLGEPGGPQFIHVAGTNGKGSVTAYLQSMLIETGYSTGSFFSPFVYDPRERIQIGRRLIPKKIFALLTQWIKPFGESLAETKFEGITEFEFKTAMGFQFWKEMEAEWVALEVGLGGRLDSTNIITPRCSVIVSIGKDHTHILGDSYAKIAEEKAGIIKHGIPVVVGEMPDEARNRILEIAFEQNSEAWVFGREVRLEGDTVITPKGVHEDLQAGISGSMQAHNMALAVAAMDAAGATRTLGGLQRGAKDATIPGRMQRVRREGREWLLDGAHNRESAKVLADSMKAAGDADRKVVLITGMVMGHEAAPLYQELKDVVHTAIFTPIDFHRAVAPEKLEKEVQGTFRETLVAKSVDEAINQALARTGASDLILVAGSFYLVGEVGKTLGLGSTDD